jgi:hypothetical protein
MYQSVRLALALTLAALSAPPLTAAEAPADFRPDPLSIQRFGKGYRYPQAGWVVLHVEGEPYERGEQHGRLMATEIAAFVRCCAAEQGSKAPEEAWALTRTLVNALFVRKIEPEYLEEMKGIADGAAAAGAKYANRPIDLTDIVALNCWPEVFTLDAGLEALPTGLEGKRFPKAQPRKMPPPPADHCSAFAATGSATPDGTIVFGHITMFGLYASNHFNVWLDVQPAKGYRVLMQSFPGGLQSGMDYYISSSGLLCTETTISQTRYDIEGLALAGRIRKALQYADSIDGAVEILKTANNGLYTNEWLLADVKTNEIAMFELGTHKSRLYRSSKNEWYGGTEGFYWGCNNTKDRDVRLETIASVSDRPANVVWRPSDRDKTWLRLYAEHKGKITADFGRLAFTTAPLAAYHSLDAKYTTSAMAKQLKTWALFGPPLGKSWDPRPDEVKKFPEIRPLIPNPWTVLHPGRPDDTKSEPIAKDLADPSGKKPDDKAHAHDELHTVVAWHGTLFPKTDADTWLAAGFAEYERIVAMEQALREKAENGKLSEADRDRLAVLLNGHRSRYLAAAKATNDTPPSRTRATPTDEWYWAAAGKGVLVLHELRQELGTDKFCEVMDAFGRANAGKEVTSAQFAAHLQAAGGKKLDGFFAYWLDRPGLPDLRLEGASVQPTQAGIGNGGGESNSFRVVGGLRQDGGPRRRVNVTVETAKGEKTLSFEVDTTAEFVIVMAERPLRVVVDKYGRAAKLNGSSYTPFAFNADRDKTLIVYGTRDEEAANKITADKLQERIRTSWSNETLPVKSDQQVTEDDLRTHHLLLVGRPDCNRVVERFRDMLPVAFGWRSFTVRGDAYAHAGSSVVAAAANPLNPRYSVTVLAGLSAEATTFTPDAVLSREAQGADVIVLPQGGPRKALVAPARELVRELGEAK